MEEGVNFRIRLLVCEGEEKVWATEIGESKRIKSSIIIIDITMRIFIYLLVFILILLCEYLFIYLLVFIFLLNFLFCLSPRMRLLTHVFFQFNETKIWNEKCCTAHFLLLLYLLDQITWGISGSSGETREGDTPTKLNYSSDNTCLVVRGSLGEIQWVNALGS
jgi:hypothetical protein